MGELFRPQLAHFMKSNIVVRGGSDTTVMDTKHPGDVRLKFWTCWKKRWPQFEGALKSNLFESPRYLFVFYSL